MIISGSCIPMSSPGLTGRSSIPETTVLESRGGGVGLIAERDGHAKRENSNHRPSCRPCESRDPYAAAVVVETNWSMAFPQQFRPVVMGPCFRRDDSGARPTCGHP